MSNSATITPLFTKVDLDEDYEESFNRLVDGATRFIIHYLDYNPVGDFTFDEIKEAIAEAVKKFEDENIGA